ncbi:MAG: hypothetical protein A2Y73_04525 [Chloroflexi bacterium RBG_13_56_8]|nr:MAG: hypothetical protein A2Y73_04525 [Chloroflexi bacterium RBG_13_56_8]
MTKLSWQGRTARDPFLLYMIFLGVGLGTILLDQPVRLALLWTTLVALSIFYRSAHQVEIVFSLPSLGRGALLGLVISLPILAFLSEQLRLFNERLYATGNIVFLAYQVCFVAAPIEEYFFRGIVQSRRTSSVSTALYAAAALIYFLPHAPFLATLLVAAAMACLGMVYGYICDRHGLIASVACHVVVGFVLQVVPSLLQALRVALS